MRRLACALGSLGSLAIVSLSAAPALAQCPDGGVICAQAGAQFIPGIQANGQISVGLPQFNVPTTAPTVQVQPAYPYAAPQAPQYYYPQRPVHVYRAPSYPGGHLALDLRLDGAASFRPSANGSLYGMGGAGLGLRYRATRHFAFEAGADIMGGSDYYDRRRLELSGNLGGLLYVNPRSRAQFYFSAGGLVDYARSTARDTGVIAERETSLGSAATTYTHLGGYGGIGLEMFATRRIAFHMDARGVVRGKVGGSSDTPEFVEPGTGRSTNVSGGFVGSAGMLLYF